MISIIENTEKSKMMGLNGKEILEKQYNLNIMLEKVLQMYNNVLKS